MRRRSSSREIEIECHHAVSLSEFDDAAIREEAKERGLVVNAVQIRTPAIDELIEEALEDLREGRTADAIVALERAVRPKWPSPDHCMNALEQIRGRAQ